MGEDQGLPSALSSAHSPHLPHHLLLSWGAHSLLPGTYYVAGAEEAAGAHTWREG